MFLTLLPPLLLVAAIVVVLVVYQARKAVGLPWLVAAATALITWGLVLALRWLPSEPAVLSGSYTGHIQTGQLVFAVNDQTWAYAFSLVSLLLAVLFSAPMRFVPDQNPVAWVGAMLVTAAGYLAVTAESILTLIIAWTLIDVLELLILLLTVRREEVLQRGVLHLGIRAVGTLFAVWGLMVSTVSGSGQALEGKLLEAGPFLLLAAGLRLGVIPLHLAISQEPTMSRDISSVLRLTGPLSSLAILSRLPPTVATPQLAVPLLLVTGLAALYGSSMWLAARNVLIARPYMIIALGGLAMACAIRGRPQAALAWGTMLLLVGGFLFLYQYSSRGLSVILAIIVLGATGIPFTPAAAGWQGLVVLPFTLLDLFMIAAYALLLIGIVRHGFKPEFTMMVGERWIQSLYVTGLVILPISYALVGVFGWKGSVTLGNPWASLGAVLLAAAVGMLAFRLKPEGRLPGSVNWAWLMIRRVGTWLAKLFSFEWLFKLIGSGYTVLSKLIEGFTRILEGDGGVLWALVLLALLFSLLRRQGGLP